MQMAMETEMELVMVGKHEEKVILVEIYGHKEKGKVICGQKEKVINGVKEKVMEEMLRYGVVEESCRDNVVVVRVRVM